GKPYPAGRARRVALSLVVLHRERASASAALIRFRGRDARRSPMADPFHYSFFVRDLESTRRFYGDVLGCREGRRTDAWVDFDFFGNQISAHTTGTVTPVQNTGEVEGIKVPMPHFGAIVSWNDFHALADRLRGAGTVFVIEP